MDLSERIDKFGSEFSSSVRKYASAFGNSVKDYGSMMPKGIINLTSDLLESSDFISRTIGTNNSYNDIMLMVQSLGHEPISLLGKDYMFIYDHVRRNFLQGTQVINNEYNIPKFTFYKERPTIRFANPYDDVLNLKDKWFANIRLENTSEGGYDTNTIISYAESSDDHVENKVIGKLKPEDENVGVNYGVAKSFPLWVSSRDLIRKTNENFKNGRYRTLIARFHTNSEDSKDSNDIKQTAISKDFGMSHGRNLLKINKNDYTNDYSNPYCRVWTYHHQYDRMTKAIRPFIDDTDSQVELESLEQVGNFKGVGFRTLSKKSEAEFGQITSETDVKGGGEHLNKSNKDLPGGSELLDKYGVLNYTTGFINIAPTAKLDDYFEGKEDSDNNKISIKRCMFSIENLAWKSNGAKINEFDPTGLSPEQRGPMGGRIMWFPPYNLTFNEESRVSWNENQFIGRGEKIYTYSNTDRTGTLSFTLLIDHPSIIDYWNGHKRNGQKNQGMPLDDGNIGGVDNIMNQENTLLRFFAGCDVLSAKPQEFKKAVKPPQKEEEKKEEKPVVQEVQKDDPPTEVTTKSEKEMRCFLYFPNNYSGVDDYPSTNTSKFNAIYYLMNGVGTGKYISTGGTDVLQARDIEDFSSLLTKNFVGISTEIKTPSEVGIECSEGHKSGCSELCDKNGIVTNISTSITWSNGGYEVYESNGGISIATELVDIGASAKTYACSSTSSRKENKGRYITTKEGNYRYCYRGLDGYIYDLAVINGPKSYRQGVSGKYPYAWYYRVDNIKKNEALTKYKDSYFDTNSFALNGNGYDEVRKEENGVKDKWGLKDDSPEFMLVSFAELFYALEGEKLPFIAMNPSWKESVGINDLHVEEIKRIISNGEENKKYEVTSISFKGHASSAGYGGANKKLAENRANTFRAWMKGLNFPGKYEDAQVPEPESSGSCPNCGGNNEKHSKMWRSAEVIIKYTATKTELPQVKNSNINAVNILGNQDLTFKGKMTLQTDETTEEKRYTKSEVEKQLDMLEDLEGDEMFNDILNRNEERMITEINGYTTNEVNRYDNEGEFFETLQKDSPFMHHLISDKIRYFDPAFHSISPEGFNARLTFLHQCTRQGATIENSSFETASAYNLAFGRPPVCVLRIGDFYNTKIVINSLSIQYENPTWDMNPEGIGVMPMFANINLTFAFIGGSDLAGPIARLQNAVSFNYYANTSVYDNRADRVKYMNDKSGREEMLSTQDYLA